MTAPWTFDQARMASEDASAEQGRAGTCHCGCGEETNLLNGRPRRFIKGHHWREARAHARSVIDRLGGQA